MNEWIKEYQCPGCVKAPDNCYEQEPGKLSCINHCVGTRQGCVGEIFLGMPIGFNRLGVFEKMCMEIFESYDNNYDMFNIPVWKYKNEYNHVIVRGLRPRINIPFLHVFLEDCIDKINCFEITEEHIKTMD